MTCVCVVLVLYMLCLMCVAFACACGLLGIWVAVNALFLVVSLLCSVVIWDMSGIRVWVCMGCLWLFLDAYSVC